MNKYILIILIIGSCTPKIKPSSAKVSYLNSIDGSINMYTIGIGKNKLSAINDAEKNAFEVLFFRGLPESQQKVPLIGANENEAKQKHPIYFDKFFSGLRYKTFLMGSIPAPNTSSIKGNFKSIAVEVKINISALRIDLEQYNIIRKFGY